MSESKSTPGPWHTGSCPGGGDLIVYATFGGDPLTHTAAGSWAVANATTYHGKIGRTQSEANARLIAAAPQLLEACQWALGTIRGNTYGLTPAEREQALELAAKDCEEAIAQATGETK